jgi:hypothetical protein
MDTPAELRRHADELEERARSLLKLSRGKLSGTPSDRPTTALGRAVEHWVIALRRLADSSPLAWEALDSRFPPEEGEPVKSPPDSDLGPAEMVADLDLITAYLAGDQVLDHLAYAELVRRDRVPDWQRGRDPVPSMWPKLMAVLDEAPQEHMSQAARYLDVTLAVARDVLVAHRDPDAYDLPFYSSWGEVKLHRPVVDDERKAAAEAIVRAANLGLEHPWPDTWTYDHLVDSIIAVPQLLEFAVRKALRDAFRLAGFESPRLTTILGYAERLLAAHTDAL